MVDILVLTVSYALLILIFCEDRVGAASQQHHSHQEGYNRSCRHGGRLACSEQVGLVRWLGLVEDLKSRASVAQHEPEAVSCDFAARQANDKMSMLNGMLRKVKG